MFCQNPWVTILIRGFWSEPVVYNFDIWVKKCVKILPNLARFCRKIKIFVKKFSAKIGHHFPIQLINFQKGNQFFSKFSNFRSKIHIWETEKFFEKSFCLIWDQWVGFSKKHTFCTPQTTSWEVICQSKEFSGFSMIDNGIFKRIGMKW